MSCHAPRSTPALLTTFLAVLEAGRISAAARAIHLSQPAVTAQIRELEEAMGAALFVRTVQGVRPTDAGLRLADVPMLWREPGSGTRAVVDRALAKAGVRRRKAHDLDVELASTEAIVGGVMAGLGVAFVSRWSVRAHVAAGFVRVRPGLDLVVRRTFRWALPTGALSGTAARFHAFAQRTPLG